MVDDVRWMRRALQHARRGVGRTTPNPLVGACVVTVDGVVVGQGAHERAGEAHAEIHALEEAGAAARGATLYCTLEPCVHQGRTGPCTERIIAAGIRRVVASMEDPFPQVSGRGFATLRAHGVQVDVGVEREAAARLNQPFLTVMQASRPWVLLKAATSLDGRVAAAPGVRTAITSAPALRHAQLVRAEVDAIAVGSGTILADDPLLTVREVFRERPLVRVVFDRRLRMPTSARLLSTGIAGPVIILTTPEAVARPDSPAAALERAGATICPVEDGGVAAGLRALVPFDVHSVLLEGGASFQCAAWDAQVVDYVQLYVAPLWIGPSGVPFLDGRRWTPSDLSERRTALLGPDVLMEGYVHRPR